MIDSKDPDVPNWSEVSLEDTWADSIDLKTPKGWLTLIRSVFGKRKPVDLPQSLSEQYDIPRYILQEFHNLPNGNYSERFSRGYITGFDLSMLGLISTGRAWIAERLGDCNNVADIGTAGGKTAATIQQKSGRVVWGIDPSPYLLKHAASDYPSVRFLQGTAERLPFQKERLDGISVCFVFHEMPPKYVKQALDSFNHCLKLGGKVAICEPSEEQLRPFAWQDLVSKKGWLRIYFRWLAHFVYEPFLGAWHGQDKRELAAASGFTLVEKRIAMPMNLYLFEKIEKLSPA